MLSRQLGGYCRPKIKIEMEGGDDGNIAAKEMEEIGGMAEMGELA